MDFYKEGKASAREAMKQKNITVCDVSDMAKDIAKSLKLKGKPRKDFMEGWEDSLAAASRRRKNPMSMGCPSCLRRYKRLRRR